MHKTRIKNLKELTSAVLTETDRNGKSLLLP